MGLFLVFLSDVCLGSIERALRFASFMRQHQEELRAQDQVDPILESLLFIARALEDPEKAKSEAVPVEIFATRASSRLALTGYAILQDEAGAQRALARMFEAGFRNAPFLVHDPHLKDFLTRDWFLKSVETMGQRGSSLES